MDGTFVYGFLRLVDQVSRRGISYFFAAAKLLDSASTPIGRLLFGLMPHARRRRGESSLHRQRSFQISSVLIQLRYISIL